MWFRSGRYFGMDERDGAWRGTDCISKGVLVADDDMI